jgi:hypothetical protein
VKTIQAVQAATDDVIEAFSTLLVDTGRATLDLPDLLRIWDSADSGWVGTNAGRIRLADTLDLLDSAGAIELPSRRGSRWDTALPRLPLRIVVPINRKPSARALDAAAEPWVPALAWSGSWIRGARPPQRLRLALVAVNRWLASTIGRSLPLVCREERSLHVFADEKMLSVLIGTALFAPGRLTLELLMCESPVGGLRIARLADEGPVLVVENKATFDSAWRALRSVVVSGGRAGYAAIVFGAGDQAPSLIGDLLILPDLLGVRPTRFEYAGDVDVAGISAMAAFIAAANAAHLCARPAMKLWRALGEAHPVGDDLTGDQRERQEAISAAARLDLPATVQTCLGTGVRVPQERIDRTALANTSWWMPESD